MLTLPDNYFFEIMRNYLGKLETPFNKHNLIEKLVLFLKKTQAEEKFISGLTSQEAVILTAIYILPQNNAASLFRFFEENIPFIELCSTLKNLEEKLIIYSKEGNIHISPLFYSHLRKKVINPGLLFKSEKMEKSLSDMLWLTDSLLLSVLSYMFHQKDLVKSSGTFKKRVFTEMETLFPNIFKGEEGEKKLNLVRRILHNLQLVSVKESSLIPVKSSWEKLADMEKKERFTILYTAALFGHSEHHETSVNKMSLLLGTLPPARSFSQEIMKRFLTCLLPGTTSPVTAGHIIEDLILLKVLLVNKDGSLCLNEGITQEDPFPSYGDTCPLIIQPNFDITFKPWITLKEGYPLALTCLLKKQDIYTEMSLTKESFIKGLSCEIHPDEYREKIASLSGKELPDNILWSLSEWEKESQKARLYDAAVIIVDEDREYILKNTDLFTPYILLNPAPCIYLIPGDKKEDAVKTLENLGIFVSVPSGGESQSPPIPFPVFETLPGISVDWDQNSLMESDESWREPLSLKISRLPASREEKEDLKNRLLRGIIINESQIQCGISQNDFKEARGINYHGKLRLIEYSLKNPGDRLEVSFARDGSAHKALIFPVKILKEGDKKFLFGKSLPEETDFTLDISKISLIRRLQTTLF